MIINYINITENYNLKNFCLYINVKSINFRRTSYGSSFILLKDITRRKIVEVSVYIKEKKMRCEALLIMDHQLCYRVK